MPKRTHSPKPCLNGAMTHASSGSRVGRRVPELTAEGSCRPTGTRSDQIPPLLPALVQVPAHVVKPVL